MPLTVPRYSVLLFTPGKDFIASKDSSISIPFKKARAIAPVMFETK